ncbi:MAG: hypothetical protein QXI19_06565 [Candidatus Caldarchaeum sp.]
MSKEVIHKFVPYLTLADWLVFLLPAFLASLFLGLGMALLFRHHKITRGFLSTVIGSLLAWWWGQGLSLLNTVEFQGSWVRIVGPTTDTQLTLRQGNNVVEQKDGFLLLTPNKWVYLPRNGRWQWGEIWVDARYLANEFEGRSQKRGRDGRLLAF